jgi:hypothetical protein
VFPYKGLTPGSFICEEITQTLYYVEEWWSVRTEPGPFIADETYFPGSLPNFHVSVTRETKSATSFLATYNPCTPWISAPTEILTMDPRWSTCFKTFRGIHDPRSILETASGFHPVTTQEPPHPSPSHTSGASAGPSIPQNFATKTAPRITPTSRPAPDPPAQLATTLPMVATVGTVTVTIRVDSTLFIDSLTLRPGEQIIYHHTTISMPSDGQAIVVDGITQRLTNTYLAGTHSLVAGGPPVTLSGATYSLPSGGSSVVVDGAPDGGTQTAGATNLIQKAWVPAYIIDGQTLMAGGLPITAFGTTMSLDPSGHSVVMFHAVTEDINVFLGNFQTASQTGPGDNGRDIESVNGTSLDTDALRTKSTSTSQKPRSGAPRSQTVQVRQWHYLVALGVSFCIQMVF